MRWYYIWDVLHLKLYVCFGNVSFTCIHVKIYRVLLFYRSQWSANVIMWENYACKSEYLTWGSYKKLSLGDGQRKWSSLPLDIEQIHWRTGLNAILCGISLKAMKGGQTIIHSFTIPPIQFLTVFGRSELATAWSQMDSSLLKWTLLSEAFPGFSLFNVTGWVKIRCPA